MAVQTQILHRRGTAATWTSTNPTLGAGEVGFETDTGKFKLGDGTTAWASLPYAAIDAALLNAKGDLVTATANDTPARLAVGANETRLVADSAQATGLKYVADTTNYAVNAKGDLLAGTAADTVSALTVGSNGQNLVADSSTATGLRWQDNFAAAKNVIINGSMDVWQRGTSFTGGQYGADRWTSGSSANTFTVSRVTGLSDFRYALKLNLNGTNTFAQLGTQIEFNNCYFLQNQTVTISFWAQANNTNAASTALTVRTRTIAGVDGACVFVGTASDTAVTITTTATKYTVTKTLPSTFGSLSLEFAIGSGTTNDGFTITGVQLELGSVASAFTRTGGTIAGELAACQRYYFRATADTSAYAHFAQGLASSTTSGQFDLKLPVTMRVEPTSVDYSTLRIEDINNAQAITSLTISSNSSHRDVATFDGGVASGLTQYRPYFLGANNSTSAYVGVSAEL